MTGALFLLTVLTGLIAQMLLSGRLIVPGDAAATAARITANKSLYELGFTVYMIEMACNVAITGLFYELLKPAGKTASLLAALFSLAGCVIKTFSRLFYLAPLSRAISSCDRPSSRAFWACCHSWPARAG